MRLLVVEDNEELSQLLAKGLLAAGFDSDVMASADEARAALATTRYAALVLDLGLPDENGLAVLREIRHRKDPLPVLVLTARGGVNDRVQGLRSGADDYLVKPFAFEELVARLEALLRRPGQLLGRSLRLANLVFDTQSRQAYIDDEPQALSARESAMLELLLRRQGRVVPKKLVEDHIFGLSGDVASNAIEVYIHRLRKQLAELRTEIGGRTVWIQAAEDLAHRDVLIDDVVTDFFHRVAWVTLPILLLLFVIDIAIFRGAVRPLLNASRMAARIAPARIDLRLPVDDIPREILPLVAAVNSALDRLQQGFRLQREFTADAAHELRTPLAVLRARIDTLTNQEVAKTLHGDFERMSHVVNQLLEIAGLETLVVDPQEKADLHDVCAEVAAFIAPLALAQRKEIVLSGAGGPVWVRGNADMLQQAIRNLVENAIKHAPQGSTVDIVVAADGCASVRDQGPGISVAERELIFQRFWRRDRRRAEGAGLGLSIVQRIAEAYGAKITIESRPSGGTEFRLHFVTAA